MPGSVTRRTPPARAAQAAASAATADLTGVVTAIVAVTGHQDSVKDIIVPSAFAQTLRAIKPKLCWMHDWKIPLGRVLRIAELRPGDKGLPTTLPDGRAWPKEAGALIATVQFNLKTTAGRDFYEHAKLWAETGEAAFSIGYAVKEGAAAQRGDGVRMIYGLDLYEVSLVLHGAHNMALVLEVKNAPYPIDEMEIKTTGGLILEIEGKAVEQPDFTQHAMVAVYPDADTAAAIAHPDGLPADDMHVTLAYLGKDGIPDPHALAATLAARVSGIGRLEGTVGGLGQFPGGDDGVPSWAPVDVNGLDQLRTAVVGGLNDAGQSYAGDHGFTPHMTLGYDLDDPSPVDVTPVSFDHAYLVVGDRRFPLPLTAPAPGAGPTLEAKAALLEARIDVARREGKFAAVALLEAESWVVEGKAGVPGIADTPSDHAAVQRLRESWSHGKVAAEIGWGSDGDFAKCVTLASEHMTPEEAKGWCNLRHHDALGIYPATHAKQLEPKTHPTPEQETKAMTAYMRGSQEQKRSELQEAVNALLTPRKKNDGDSDSRECGWCSIEATFQGPLPADNYVIVSVYKDGDRDDAFKVPYSWDGDDVSLGVPQKVELAVVATLETAADPVGPVEVGEAVRVRLMDPARAAMSGAARFISAMPAAVEGKGLEGLTDPLMEILDQLAGKGYDVAKAVLGDDDLMWSGNDDDTPDEHDQYATEKKAADPADDDDTGEGDGEDDPFDPMDEPNEPDSLTDGTATPPDGLGSGDADDDLAAEPDPTDEGDDPDPADPDDEEGKVLMDPDTVHKELAALRA